MAAAVTSRVVSIEQMGRLSTGIDGTYGFTSLGSAGTAGQVTTSAGMVVAVAAVPASTTVINGTVNTNAYAGGTVTIGTSDPALPRIDIVWESSAGAVAVAAGTAAATPIPPTIGATGLELGMVLVGAAVTSITASDIIDRRQLRPTSWEIVGTLTTEATTTSTSATTLATITLNRSVAANEWIRITGQLRKDASAAQVATIGLAINGTTCVEAAATTSASIAGLDNTQVAEDGIFEIIIAPVSTSYRTGIQAWCSSRATATGVVQASPQWTITGNLTAIQPNAARTTIGIRGINVTSNNNLAINNVVVWAGRF